MRWKEINNRKDLLGDYKQMNAYEILNIAKACSIEEVKQAYKKLVKIYHPDISDDFLKATNQEIVKLINNAYRDVIKEKRGDGKVS